MTSPIAVVAPEITTAVVAPESATTVVTGASLTVLHSRYVANAALLVSPRMSVGGNTGVKLISAALTVAPVLSSSGQRFTIVTASLSVTPSRVAAVTKVIHASASLTVTPTVSTGGRSTRFASSTLSVTPALIAAAKRGAYATASLTVTPVEIAIEVRQTSKGALLTVTPIFTAAAKLTAKPAVALTVTPARTVTAAKVIHANAAVTVTPTVTSSGTAKHVNSATLTVTPAVSTAATVKHYANASLTVTPAVSTATGKSLTASAALTVTPVTSTAASKTTRANAALTVTPVVLTGDAAYSQVVALLHADGSNGSTTFTDNSPLSANFTAVNGAVVSTAQSKFGGASASFPNSNSYLTATAPSSNFAFGTADFTIEAWVYLNSGNTGYNAIYDARSAGTQNGLTALIYTYGTGLYFYTNGGNAITATAPTTNSWHHLAVCRASGSHRMYLDGTQVGSTYTNSNSYLNAGGPLIGNGFIPNAPWQGYIDEVRVTNGYARYTSNFTPPTTPFTAGSSLTVKHYASATLSVTPSITAAATRTAATTKTVTPQPSMSIAVQRAATI